MAGKHVLELGAGVALPGLVAAAAGASRVTLTARADCPEVLTNAMANAEYNGLDGVCEAVPLTWGESDDATPSG